MDGSSSTSAVIRRPGLPSRMALVPTDPIRGHLVMVSGTVRPATAMATLIPMGMLMFIPMRVVHKICIGGRGVRVNLTGTRRIRMPIGMHTICTTAFVINGCNSSNSRSSGTETSISTIHIHPITTVHQAIMSTRTRTAKVLDINTPTRIVEQRRIPSVVEATPSHSPTMPTNHWLLRMP